MANTASGRHIRRILGGAIPQDAIDGLEESLAAASTDGLRIANAVTTDYTLALSDLGKAVDVNSGTAKAVTVPPNSTVAYPVGALIEVHQVGAGAVSLAAGVGVTLEGSTTVPAQGGSLLLRKRATNTWTVTDLAPSGTYVQAVTVGEGGTHATLAAAVAAAPSGGRIELVSELTVAAATVVDKSVHIDGKGFDFVQSTANTRGLEVTSSDVTIENLGIIGPQHLVQQTSGRAIDAHGASADAPIQNLLVKNCRIRNWGYFGVHAKHVHNARTVDCTINDIRYAGVIYMSVVGGEVTDNTIDNIVGSPLAYGITLNREELADLVTAPRTENVPVSGNKVSNIPNWEAIDTHGGKGCPITGNTIRATSQGIVLAPADALGVQTWAPINCPVTGNTMDSELTTGTGKGIVVSGAGGAVGDVTEYATGCPITGNTIRGYGIESDTNNGAILLQKTLGQVVSGNQIYEPSPHGINWYFDNKGWTCEGNTITDPWSMSVTTAACIIVTSANNTGTVDGNFAARGSKSATYVLITGLRVNNVGGVRIALGNNSFDNADIPANDIIGDNTEWMNRAKLWSFQGESPPTPRATMTGSRLGNSALAALLAELDIKGVVTDATVVGVLGSDVTWPSGSFLQSEGTVTTAGLTNDRVVYTPLWIPEAADAVTIAVDMTISGSVGSVIRVGLVLPDANGRPGTFLLDGGTIDSTVAAATLTKVITAAVPVGLIWVATCGQGAPSTAPTVRAHSGWSRWMRPTSVATAATRSGYLQTGVSGAFPASATPSLTSLGAATCVALQRA
jgi:hypothetical protein